MTLGKLLTRVFTVQAASWLCLALMVMSGLLLRCSSVPWQVSAPTCVAAHPDESVTIPYRPQEIPRR